MPKIIAASHALPPHVVPQSAVKEGITRLFADKIQELDRLATVFDHSRIESRQFMMPVDWYLQPRSPVERNRVYREKGLELLTSAAEKCLAAGGCEPCDIDHVIFVSSTGHATPTLDAYLINTLRFRPGTTRLPIWGLGCAGGAAGLARAYDYCLAHPQSRVLVLALECCSLTFALEDATKKNLVAASLFSDGCAAALVAGARVGLEGVTVKGRGSHLFRDTYRIMGWDFMDEGMYLVLSPRLPAVVKEELPGLVGSFLASHGLRPADIVHYVTHPGGAKVIDAYREALGLDDWELGITEEILRRHGNLSSASVLMVLEKWLAKEKPHGPGLLSAFGPGFSAELLLLEV